MSWGVVSCATDAVRGWADGELLIRLKNGICIISLSWIKEFAEMLKIRCY